MIHPSYNELYEAINKNSEDEEPILSSRYSVCLATAKRARQIIDGADPLVNAACNKPLSIAIDEIYNGKVEVQKAEEDSASYEADIYADESIEA